MRHSITVSMHTCKTGERRCFLKVSWLGACRPTYHTTTGVSVMVRCTVEPKGVDGIARIWNGIWASSQAWRGSEEEGGEKRVKGGGEREAGVAQDRRTKVFYPYLAYSIHLRNLGTADHHTRPPQFLCLYYTYIKFSTISLILTEKSLRSIWWHHSVGE